MKTVVRTLTISAALACGVAACSGSSTSVPAGSVGSPTPGPALRQPGTASVPTLTVTSATFTSGAAMPTSVALTACGGNDISPQLTWSAGPAGTQSYAVTEFDQDAPTGVGFWHWVAFDIPASVTSLAAGAGTTPTPPAQYGLTDYGSQNYGGPCPPTGDGPHRYTFTVSALDIPSLPGLSGPSTTGAFLTFNERGHIIAQGALLGTYAR